MAHIELTISNINNRAYSEIVMRKFFHMIFISPDGRKLNIYTATVFGGIKSDGSKDAQENGNMAIPKCAYSHKAECSLKFEYSSNDNSIKKIEFTNLTESLVNQTKCLEQVWKHFDKLDSQEEVKTAFESLYGENAPDINMTLEQPIYHIYEEGKINHECIAMKGSYKLSDSKNPNAYHLRSHNPILDGVEYINWVKTEITLSDSILEKLFIFKINLNRGAGCEYYTPDFTWYFAPPASYSVDCNTAIVKCGVSNEYNMVHSVIDETTVNFEEWVGNEHIRDRQKARLHINQHTGQNPKSLSENGGVEARIFVRNPHHSANRQFFYGMLIAFILAFCADKTRLEYCFDNIAEICKCTEMGKVFTCEQFSNLLGFLFPILALITYATLMLNTKKCIPMDNKGRFWAIRIVKGISVACAVTVLLYVLLFWSVWPLFMQKCISSCTINSIIIWSLYLISFVISGVYLGYCVLYKKKKVIDSL